MRFRLLKIVLAISLSLSGAIAVNALTPPKQAEAASSVTKANNIIATGLKYLGVRYKFGAKTGNTSSFDCSSFTQYIFRKQGIYIPRTSKAQSRAGYYVAKKNLKRGDLVFFYSPVSHVGVYIGNGKILHTYGKPGVTISSINSGWWKNHYKTARRVIR